jgi:hypothetical protein
MKSRVACCLILVLFVIENVSAQKLPRADRDLFEIHVRPTLVAHCIRCHGDAKQEGGLKLTSFEELMEGGDSGGVIVEGKPAESLIMEAMRYESFEMPPDGQLDDEVIAGLAKWITAGAPWPEGTVLEPTPEITDEDREWWCYQPLADPALPEVEDDRWCRVDIDRFVLERLEQNGIAPAQQADPLVLARRVHFAITGLPPDEATIDSVSSGHFDYQAVVDRLLESDAYGENQARYWLDLVRYAETDGYRADFSRPEAHRYRDYVIQAFNEDKPYDRFIREQIAGDEIDPGNRDALIATMYLRHWIYEHNQRDVETQWHEILSDITETTSDVFLAQGFRCARCHDHKFDPILQKDYYRMKAFFAAFQPAEAHPIADVDTRAEYQQKLRDWEQATLDIRKRLREIEEPLLLKHATREGFDKFIPKIKAMIRTPPQQRTPYEHQIASLAARQYDLPHDKLPEWLSEEEEQERQVLRKELAEFDAIKPEPLPAMSFVGSDIGPVAPPTFIPDDQTKSPIAPGFPTLLDASDAVINPLPPSLRSTGRRTALADWIASADNPLTARVIVNRVWQQHFGRGLVDTSSDFGRLGTPPSHPELLDWLARRFIQDGWSLKKLHRLILTSATYQQTSLRPLDDRLRKIDPGNRLLWRMSPRRLSGEEITDAVLAASGELNKEKRAIYKPVKRNAPDPLLAAFDAPDRIRSVGRRHRTTSSTQALLLANGDWLHERASAVVSRVMANRSPNDPSDESEDLVHAAYRTLFGRQADTDELGMALQFLDAYADQTPAAETRQSNLIVEMPVTGKKAVDLRPGGTAVTKLSLTKRPGAESPSNEDFTVQAIVLLRSLYKDASVRTIVASWTGNKDHAGWSLGVTSTKSAYQPRNLILQLVGNTAQSDQLHYEVVPSGLRPELNKPYLLAASIKLSDTSERGITFYMKDLSDQKSELQIAQATHTVVGGVRSDSDLTIGGRIKSHHWDGLIDSLQIENMSRDLARPVQADSEEGLPQYAIDLQFEDPENPGLNLSGNQNHLHVEGEESEVSTPINQARVALIHALLNSNELIYVD